MTIWLYMLNVIGGFVSFPSKNPSRQHNLKHSLAAENEATYSASRDETQSYFSFRSPSNRSPSNQNQVFLSWFSGQETTSPIIVTIYYRMHRLFWSKYAGSSSGFDVPKHTVDCITVWVQWRLTVLWKDTSCIDNIVMSVYNQPYQRANSSWYGDWTGGSSTLPTEHLVDGIL